MSSRILLFLLLVVSTVAVAVAQISVEGGSIYGTIANINGAHRFMGELTKKRYLQSKDQQQYTSGMNHDSPQAPLVARVAVHGTDRCNKSVYTDIAVSLTAYDGSFELHDIPEGSYTMTITGLGEGHLVFPLYRLDMVPEDNSNNDNDYNDIDMSNADNSHTYISESNSKRLAMLLDKHHLNNNNNNTVKRLIPFLYTNEGTPYPIHGGTADRPSQVHYITNHQYYIPREDHSLSSILRNPMILMMGFSGLMVLMMRMLPKEELKQQMKEVNDMMGQSKSNNRIQQQGGKGRR